MSIHASACVHHGAIIGENVSIGHCALIEDQVVIGDGTVIGPFSHVRGRTVIGRNNLIGSHVVLGGDPQDLKFAGEDTELIIGDNNTIREFASVHRGTVGGGGITRIGSNCLIMCYAHVAHDCLLGDAVIMSNAAMLAGHVRLDDHVCLGGMSGIHQFTRIGEYAFVGGVSGVGQDVPPYMLASGGRAKNYGPNLIGLRRQGFDNEVIAALRAAYRRIWRSEMPKKEALESVEAEFGHLPPIRTLLEFVRGSERGIISPAGDDDKA